MVPYFTSLFMAIKTLSKTVISLNRRIFWNVLARPIAVILYGFTPFSFTAFPSFSNSIVPSLGTYTPVNMLNNVVLPAPFGPIRPTSSPSLISIFTLEFAQRPSKFFVNFFTESKGILIYLLFLFPLRRKKICDFFIAE